MGDNRGETRVCYSGGPGDIGKQGTGGNGGGGGYALTIDPTLEPITRQIMAAMGGTQPTEIEWEFLFPSPIKCGGGGGSMGAAIHDRMMTAYRLAQQGFRKSETN